MKNKLNQPDVETTTTNINLETQTIIASNYPRKTFKPVADKIVGVPATTEEEIFKEFFKIGFSVNYSEDNKYLVDLINTEEMSIIKIDKKGKRYIKVNSVNYSEFVPISFEEHQLLHKLFKIWGWFDE